MEFLSAEFGFDHIFRRVRCVGYILNLIAKAIMIGSGSGNEPDMDVFEQQLEALARDEREPLAQWRKRGPVGRLHNIVVWICRSPQRIEAFEDLQRKAIDEGNQFTGLIYKLVHDNDTRWNSLLAMIERALKLRGSIDEFIFREGTKWNEYEIRWQAKNGHKSKPPKKRKRLSILDDQLSAEDWHTLSQYDRILRPLKDATLQLEGHVGRHGHIWEVLPMFQQLLEHLERVKDLYTVDNEIAVSQAYPEAVELQQGHHFRFNINLAWQKLNEYYERLDDTPVHTAALVLHPRYNWAWIQRHWSDRTDWIKNANLVLRELWQQYSDLPNRFDDSGDVAQERPSSPVPRSAKRLRRQFLTNSDEEMRFAYSSEEDSPPASLQDQWQEYTFQRSDKSVKDPYAWWWSMRRRWPQLAMMALDILTIAPMSGEPEGQFSDTGMMVTNRRNRLKRDTIAAAISLKSWTRESVLSWTRSSVKALVTDAGADVTNATDLTNRLSSNQSAESTNRPIE